MKENCLFPLVLFMSGRIIIKTPTSMIEIDDTLLIEFLGGKLDATTSAEVERWYDASDENRRRLERLYLVFFTGERLSAAAAVDPNLSCRRCVGASRRAGAPHRRNGCAPSSAMRPSSPSDSSPQVRCCFPTGLRTTAPVRSRPKSGPARSVSPTVRTYD